MSKRNIQISIAGLFATILLIVVARNIYNRPDASSPDDQNSKSIDSVSLSPLERTKVNLLTSTVREVVAESTIPVAGDLISLPGKSVLVTAPFSGTLKAVQRGVELGSRIEANQVIFFLTPSTGVQRDLKTTLKADLESALARSENAQQQLVRTRTLYQGKATSKKNLELAEQEAVQAKALHTAAERRLNTISSNPFDADVELSIVAPIAGVLKQLQGVNGQNIPAGAPLFEIVDLSSLWLRVPIYAGDFERFKDVSEIQVREGHSKTTFKAIRVNGPLTADPLTSTIDLYFEINHPPSHFRPGHRVVALLPRHKPRQMVLSIPESSIVYDPSGSEWVYLQEGENFRRQRVDVLEIVNSNALVSHGLEAGQVVVDNGAAELLGVEAGMSKK